MDNALPIVNVNCQWLCLGGLALETIAKKEATLSTAKATPSEYGLT